jgi:hypothetical protein
MYSITTTSKGCSFCSNTPEPIQAAGLPEVAAPLTPEPLTGPEQFVAACARGERGTWPGSLDDALLRMLPDLVEAGCTEGVRAMVESGWPIDSVGGDWIGCAGAPIESGTSVRERVHERL